MSMRVHLSALHGMGQTPAFCAPSYVGPLSQDEQAQCDAATSAAASYQTVHTAQGDYQIINGQIFDPNGNPVKGIPGGPTSGVNFTMNEALVGGAAIVALLLYMGSR